jgi:hypothetical protein
VCFCKKGTASCIRNAFNLKGARSLFIVLWKVRKNVVDFMHTADKTEGWRAQYACDFVLPCADDYDAMLDMVDEKLMYVPKFKARAGPPRSQKRIKAGNEVANRTGEAPLLTIGM